MKAFVITILNNEHSVASAKRCIASGKKYNLEIETSAAYTPEDNPEQLFRSFNLNPAGFRNNPYSREDRAMSAFLSHYRLWKHAADNKESVLIFEHDAVMVSPLPTLNGSKGCVSLGRPSYGKYNIPRFLGLQELQSKPYFPGAHAYYVTWQAAEVLIKKAKSHAAPTDVFLNKNMFPFLQEFYPWPAEVRETFSTIQKERGCLAKHMYNKEYKLI